MSRLVRLRRLVKLVGTRQIRLVPTYLCNPIIVMEKVHIIKYIPNININEKNNFMNVKI